VDGTVIWISACEFAGDEVQCGPRILVVPGDTIAADGLSRAVEVTTTSPPQVLGNLPTSVEVQVVRFVDLNRTALLRHWDGELDSAEMIALLTTA